MLSQPGLPTAWSRASECLRIAGDTLAHSHWHNSNKEVPNAAGVQVSGSWSLGDLSKARDYHTFWLWVRWLAWSDSMASDSGLLTGNTKTQKEERTLIMAPNWEPRHNTYQFCQDIRYWWLAPCPAGEPCPVSHVSRLLGLIDPCEFPPVFL